MIDSSGNGLNGAIGTEITTGVTYDGATGHRFPYATPNTPPTQPNHTVVPNSSLLNPGTDDYAVTSGCGPPTASATSSRRVSRALAGGYFKFENPNGIVTCLFRGPLGSNWCASLRDLTTAQWHTIRCERTEYCVTMCVDGVLVGNVLGVTGTSRTPGRSRSPASQLRPDRRSRATTSPATSTTCTIEGPGTVSDTTAPSTPAKPSVASPCSGRAPSSPGPPPPTTGHVAHVLRVP